MRLLFLTFLCLLAAPPPPKSLLSLNATVHECRVTKALLQSAAAPASHEKPHDNWSRLPMWSTLSPRQGGVGGRQISK